MEKETFRKEMELQLVKELKKGFVEKKRFCWEWGIDERLFRSIISDLAVNGTPIVSLSNKLGYTIPQYTGDREKDEITLEMIEHQLREYDSRIKVLRDRKRALKELKERIEG